MSITDELREYARHLHNVWYDPLDNVYTYTTMDFAPSLDAVRLDGYVLAIADRIDAEHEAKVAYWQEASYKDGYDEGFASADDWLAQHEDAMAEHGWIRLPHDRNGKLIRVGDKVMDVSDKWHNTFEVNGFLLNFDYEWSVCGEDMDAEPKDLIHHRAPTVEDVLREMLDAWGELPSNMTNEAIIAEYAAKLRLADE